MFVRTTILIVFLAMDCTAALGADPRCVPTSYNPSFGIPPGYTEDQGFNGRFDYPSTTGEAVPDFVSTIDFRTDWHAYMNAVLDYVLDGNEDGTEAGVSNAFHIQDNHKRNWYHGLWMDRTPTGREFLHGLTAERPTLKDQLKEGVDGGDQTWAIGFYNEIGATTFAKIFKEPCQPDLTNVLFPVGTVSFKLLFSTVSDEKVPYLKGAPTWDGDIDRVVAHKTTRVPQQVHLIQLDFAVRDPRAGTSGWVFGTFVYSTDVVSTDPWHRLAPVGLMWGNDANAEADQPITQSMINTELKGVTYGWANRLVMGWQGRLNGPLDNLNSSCLSCHGSAQFPRSLLLGNVPSKAVDPDPKNRTAYGERLRSYFRDIAPGEVFDSPTRFFNDNTNRTLVHAISLDYSLQIQTGLEHLCQSARDGEKPFDVVDVPTACVPSSWTAAPLRTNVEDQAAQRKELDNVDWKALNAAIR
ncbi:hypothetical protein NKI96_21255 [Mesorhizobium sp. M0292]|uniref:hypothetical protein n=1 Tax=Mesorhizobium sp. M0292 TaxID=2956929 RepID=UPI003334AC38